MINKDLQKATSIVISLHASLSHFPQKKMHCPNTKLQRTTQEIESLYPPERTTAEQLINFSHSSHQLHFVA